MSWVEKLDITVIPEAALNSIYMTKLEAYMVALESEDADAIASTMAVQEKFRVEIARRAKTATPSGNFENTVQMRAMQSWFTESCPKFGPAVDVALFIQALENGFKLYVESNASLEHAFIQTAVSKMCSDYSTTFTNHADFADCAKSYVKFKKYLKENAQQTHSTTQDRRRKHTPQAHRPADTQHSIAYKI